MIDLWPSPRESNDTVKVRDRNGIPGMASQRTCLESTAVVGEMGDDHFHDIVREGGWERAARDRADRTVRAGRSMRGASLWRSTSEEAVDLGFATIPNGHLAGREFHPYGASGTEVRVIHRYWRRSGDT